MRRADGSGAGCIPEAIARYESAIALARKKRRGAVLAEALRRTWGWFATIATIMERASTLGRESCRVAQQIGNDLLAAEAYNALGCTDLKTGLLDSARTNFLCALELGGQSGDLRARVEQNLGILANIRGDYDAALAHYELNRTKPFYSGRTAELLVARSLRQPWHYRRPHRGAYDDADRYFKQCSEIAERAGDLHLQGASLVSHAEVHAARQRYEEARHNARSGGFSPSSRSTSAHVGEKAEAYRVIWYCLP